MAHHLLLIAYPLSLLFVLLFTACAPGDPSVDALHRTADSLMGSRPDSALHLLRTLDGTLPQLGEAGWGFSPSRRQLMRHELLRAKAMNKAYVDFSTDSVMKVVADWYDRHGTPNERMEAHYLLGCVYRDMGEAPQALLCLQDAADCADTVNGKCDYSLLSKVYGQTGHLFLSQSLYHNALDAFKASKRYAWIAHDTLAAILTYGQYADCYYGLGDEDKTLEVFEKTYRMLSRHGYGNHANTFLSVPIYILLSKGRFQEVKPYLDIYEHYSAVSGQASSNISEYKMLFYYKGLYYAGTDEPDSAALCFRELSSHNSNTYERMLSYSGFYMLYRKLNSRDSLDKYISLYKESVDSFLIVAEKSRLQDIHSLYDYTRHQHIAAREAERADGLKHWLTVCTMASLAILLAVWMMVKHVREADRKRLRLMTDKYVTNLLECQFLRSEQEDIRKKKDLLTAKYDRICREMEAVKRENMMKEGTITMLTEECEGVEAKLRTISGKLDTVSKAYEEAKLVLSQGSGKDMDEWDMEDAIMSMPIVTRMHQNALCNKAAPESLWEELCESIHPLMPNFMEKMDGFNMRKKSKGYKLCILTRLHFSLSEICVLLGMSSQALNNMRRRMHTRLFGGEGAAHEFDEIITGMHR